VPFSNYQWTTPWSVGALLEQKWPMGYVPPEALERGSQVHSIIEAIDTGSLAPTPPPHLQGYVDAWKKFTYALSPSWDKVEYAFDNPELGFHGIVDRVGTAGAQGLRTIADAKTGKVPSPLNGPTRISVQLALYALGVYPNSATEIVRIAVECSKDGRYRVVRFESPDDFIVAQQLLETMHDYTHNHSHR
jgi:hypothetical protein